MRKSLYLLLGVFLLNTFELFAQVDPSTGRAIVNFPLYNYNNGGKLSTSISLTYVGGNGIKVVDLASNVGLGWALDAGGVITRSTRGEPDDQIGGKLSGDMYATGRAYSPYSATSMPAKAALMPLFDYKVPFFRHDATVIDDRELDVFNFSFNGHQGSFVISTSGAVKLLDNSKLKIENVVEDLSASKILTRWSKFVITDESGIRYTFSDKATDRIIFYEGTNPKKFFLNPAPANLDTYVGGQNYKISDYSVVNTWYLSEIYDPLANEKVTFSYEDYNLEYQGPLQGVFTQNPTREGHTKQVAQNSTPRFKGVAKRLVGISMPGNNQVQLTYYNSDRVDLTGDKALQKIAIKKNNADISGYLFDYQYFCLTNLRDFTYGFTAAEATSARLSLKSFRKYGQKVGQLLDQPYVFIYNLGGTLGVPARNTPAMDHYGYFNSATTYLFDTDEHTFYNIRNICSANSRTVIGSVNIMGAGVLTGIKYPAGGTFTYEYEANAAQNGTNTVRTGGIRVKKTTLSDGVNANSDIVKEYRYILEDGSSSGWGYEAPQYTEVSKSRMIITTEGTYSPANMAVSLAMPLIRTLIPSNIRVIRLVKPTGVALTQAQVVYATMIMSVVSVAITYIVDQFSSHIVTEDQTTDVSFSESPQTLNPLPMLYSRVEVYEGTVSDNLGKTVMEYTSDKDFNISFPSLSYTNAGKQRCFPGIFGLPKSKQVFNKRNELVESSYTKYSPYLETVTDIGYQSSSYKPNMYISAPEPIFNNNASLITFVVDRYFPLIAKALIAYTVDKKFSGAEPEVTKTEYEYDAVYNSLRKVIKWNSRNEKEEERLYYPYDYTGLSIAQEMMNKHIFDKPISTERWLTKQGQEEQLVESTLTDFQIIGNGEIKPVKKYLFSATAPVAKNTIGVFDPSLLLRNNTYFKESESYLYNSFGKLLTASTFNRASTYIYDDNNEQIISKIGNASSSDIGYSSFEPGAKGSWTVTPTGSLPVSISNSVAPTGEYCLNMPVVQSISKTGLDVNKKYILSFWKKDGSITVSGGVKTEETNVMTKNGWTLVSMYISQVANVSITGNGLLDELRLFPVGAVMNSATFDSQSNVTSSMGPDNIATYNSYDELGRLIATYDADRNLVSATQYNYRQ
jgi:hypothetical protein